MRELENRMVIDREWGELKYGVPEPKPKSVWDDDAPEPDDEEPLDDWRRETWRLA